MREITVQLPHRFDPREYQKRLIRAFQRHVCDHEGPSRFFQRWHRRAGKDLTDFAALEVPATQERVGTYYHLYPTYNQGRKALWDGMDRDGVKFVDRVPPQLIKKVDDSEMRIEFVNGSAWQIVGGDNMKRLSNLVGTNPVGVVFSEFSLQNPAAWDLFSPILDENGGWAVFNGTPRGKNHMYDVEQMALKVPSRWHVDVLTAEQTGVIPVGRLEEMRQESIAKNGDDSWFQQEWMVSYNAAVAGAYYVMQCARAESSGRFGKSMLFDPTLPVYDVWDLGVSDAMAVGCWQNVGNEWRMIEYVEFHGKGILEVIIELQKRPYVWGSHFAPHDINAREQTSGTTRWAQAKAVGWEFEVVPSLKVQDGIDRARLFFEKCWFDSQLAAKFIRLIPQYTKEYDEDGKCFLNRPNHDWTSHGADMFRYTALVADRMHARITKEKAKAARPLPPPAPNRWRKAYQTPEV